MIENAQICKLDKTQTNIHTPPVSSLSKDSHLAKLCERKTEEIYIAVQWVRHLRSDSEMPRDANSARWREPNTDSPPRAHEERPILITPSLSEEFQAKSENLALLMNRSCSSACWAILLACSEIICFVISFVWATFYTKQRRDDVARRDRNHTKETTETDTKKTKRNKASRTFDLSLNLSFTLWNESPLARASSACSSLFDIPQQSSERERSRERKGSVFIQRLRTKWETKDGGNWGSAWGGWWRWLAKEKCN